MEKSSFFNAQMDASGEYDREYLAEDFASYFSKFISNGVFPNPSTGLQVIAADTPNMTVTLSVGYGYINGYKYENTAPLTFSIGVADGVLNRKDAIFIRYSKLGRAIKAYKIAGTPGASAVAPSVVRTEDYYDLCVAIISVNAGITVIPQSLIEDTRLNTSLCGIVTGLVEQVDTTTLYNQIQSDLSQFKTVSQAEFDAWFDDLKGKLGEDPATALQLQVDNLNAAAVGDSFKLKGAPVSIAYAGANRIASITAYGETPQGGTVEAPVALTGVDSVFVGGRNLLPKATKTQTIYGVTFTPNPDGSVSVSGTCAGGIATYNYADNLIPISPNQVVCLSGASQLVKVVINEKTPSGAFVRNVLVDRGQGISGTLTKQKEENILYATLQVQIGDTPNLTIYPMLNLGNTAMPYEPYQGSVTPLPIPRPLRRVGDVQDVCRTRVKSVYDKRIVLNGSEDWKQSGAGVTYLILCNDIALGNHIESSYLMAKEDDALYSRKVGIAANSKNCTIRVYLPNNANPTTFFASNPLTVYYQSTSYNGTNGLDVCLTEYQTGFVELDGTENWSWNTSTAWAYIATFLPNNKTGVAPVCSHYQGTGAVIPAANQVAINELGSLIIKDPSWKSVDDAKAYLAAQKAAGTPVQIAYQLATPETYATDPIDFDNAAGPLTVLTGGAVEVRMTELVGSRSPELAGKMDKATYDADGDGVVNEAEKVSNALTLKNAAGEVVATFDGSEAAILQLTAALVGALGKTEKAADSSKLAGLTPVIDNPGPSNRNSWYFPFTGTNNRDGTRKYYAALYADNATTAGRASNLSMGLSGTDLWVYYS